MASNSNHFDDPFVETRMPLPEHIEVLRRHLLRALAGFVIAMGLSFFIGEPVLKFIAEPVSQELMHFYRRRIEKARKRLHAGESALRQANELRPLVVRIDREQLARVLNLPMNDLPETIEIEVQVRPVEMTFMLAESDRLVNRPPTLATLSVTEAFTVYIKVCIFCGIVLASPWIFYQLWSFAAAGLYPHEKHWVRHYLPLSLGLFLAGVALCEFVVIPKVVEFLLSFNESIGFEPDLRLSEWLGFALFFPLVFGAAFQTPVVMVFLHRLHIVNVETFRRQRRLAFFVLAVVAAVITASPDPISMLALTFPLWALYEFGVLLCRFTNREDALLEVDTQV